MDEPRCEEIMEGGGEEERKGEESATDIAEKIGVKGVASWEDGRGEEERREKEV